MYDRDCEQARKVRAAERAIAAVERHRAELGKLLAWLNTYADIWVAITNKTGERVY